MLSLGQIISRFGCITVYHCYVDDTQLYFSVKPDDFSNLAALHNCLAAIKARMSQLNSDNTELLTTGPENTTNSIFQCIGPLALCVKPNSWKLGVITDPQLKLKHHVNKLVQSCFFQLRNIAKCSLSQAALACLQLVQNAAARQRLLNFELAQRNREYLA